MSRARQESVEGLTNTRDLVAKVIEMAKVLSADEHLKAALELRRCQVSEARARSVFEDTLALLRPNIADRLAFKYHSDRRAPSTVHQAGRVELPRQRSVRYEMLRRLVEAKVTLSSPVPSRILQQQLGLSEHPIRRASQMLEAAGLVQTSHAGRELMIEPWECTPDLLAKVGARPFQTRYRFKAGATPLSAEKLVKRFEAVAEEPYFWVHGGVHAARLIAGSRLDISGLPRVNLVVSVASDAHSIDLSWLHEIVPRMESEPNPLETAPLVVEIVREVAPLPSQDTRNRVSGYADTVLALVDQGLNEQARELVIQLRSGDGPWRRVPLGPSPNSGS